MPGITHDLISRLVVAIDRQVIKRLGIWAYSDDADCIMRLALVKAQERRELRDGTVIYPGDKVGNLHFWNERMPLVPPGGPDLAWAKKAKRTLLRTFRLLADYLANSPDMANINAVGGDLHFNNTPGTVPLFRRLGLVVFPIYPRGPVEKMKDFLLRFWALLLGWAYNPESIKGQKLSDIQCFSVWFSRHDFIALYGKDQAAKSPS